MSLIAFLKHRISSYICFIQYLYRRLTNKALPDREKNYWGYIAESRNKNCKHEEIRKISHTKFYCTRCGSTLRYLREEVSIIAEIAGILLTVFLVLRLKRKNSGKPSVHTNVTSPS